MLKILKIEMINWCYTENDQIDMKSLTDRLDFEFKRRGGIDLCVIERISQAYYTVFNNQIDKNTYRTEFITSTTNGNHVVGGSIAVYSKDANSILSHTSLNLPSSKKQWDGGQPGKLHVFSCCDTFKIVIGCMPQNLGRDEPKDLNMIKQKYFEVLDMFWPNRKDETDILPIAIWPDGANKRSGYEIHVWQLNIEDAILDDQFLYDWILNNKEPVISLVEEFGKNTDVVRPNIKLLKVIEEDGKNTTGVYTNSERFSNIVVEDVNNIPGVNDTSIANYITIETGCF
jgi:hypothetical protein